ncbi:hypothetical protein [Mycoplasmopsis agalactiae]|uniref:hypothetical protein n=1 Tax=Mycoplasmopsis agalactiae TaxID=2110 RepID=UPI001F482961|nr:hypothetical protein [Mycoplasmopsis agalactiae]MCE6115417.1 hypothetical protein [Mycoplasmopsis agalactiae]
MKRKLILIAGGLAFASSFSMIAASCDGKTKEVEKEIKEPVKKEDSKVLSEKSKTEVETSEADGNSKSKSDKTESPKVLGTSKSDPTSSSSNTASNSESLKDKIVKKHLESASKSTLKLFDGTYSSSKSQVLSPTEKENKAQKERENKANAANLISGDKRTNPSSEGDKKLVNGWTNSTSNGGYAPGVRNRTPVNSPIS